MFMVVTSANMHRESCRLRAEMLDNTESSCHAKPGREWCVLHSCCLLAAPFNLLLSHESSEAKLCKLTEIEGATETGCGTISFQA